MQPAGARGTAAGGEEFSLRRGREGPLRATFLELFFDLAYIFAFAQLSNYLIANLDWAGAGRTLVLLLPLWWMWTSTSWITDVLDPGRAAVQLHVLVLMVGILVMAASVPHAYGSARPIFAGVYVASQVGAGIYYSVMLRRTAQHRPTLRTLFWFCLSAVPWLTGAFVREPVGEALWAFAILTSGLALSRRASARWRRSRISS